jgi:hypothetical protein
MTLICSSTAGGWFALTGDICLAKSAAAALDADRLLAPIANSIPKNPTIAMITIPTIFFLLILFSLIVLYFSAGVSYSILWIVITVSYLWMLFQALIEDSISESDFLFFYFLNWSPIFTYNDKAQYWCHTSRFIF